jgi:chromosome segregation ATPase
VNEVLLTVLNETLTEIAEGMRSVQAVIEKRQEEVQRAQEEVNFAEDQEECAAYEDGQAVRKAEVLRVYLSRLEKPPRVLLGKMKRLSDEQERTTHARDVAGGRVANTRSALKNKHTQLAVAEQSYMELQKQWSGVSEHIANAQRANEARE